MSDKVQITVRTVALGAAAADEWIPAATLGLSWIDAIVGYAPIGTTAFTVIPTFLKNAQGTGETEGGDAGDLGVECADGDDVMEITVIGTPA
jgi:hypothetical protein